MSDRYLPFSSDDLERDMQDRQSCRVCGRTCSSTVGVCRSPVCTSALVERLEQQLAELREAVRSGEASDGYHTHNELYEFRKLYNATLFNEWAKSGKYHVHKSLRHHDGDECFGGGWFIVVAQLPAGQITNHYKLDCWDMFRVQETEKALFEYDGHTGADTIDRLKQLLQESDK